MRKLIAASVIAATTVGGALPAFASAGGSGAEGHNCQTIDEHRTVNGVSVNTGRHQVCETHSASGSGVSVSVTYSGSAPSAGFDQDAFTAGLPPAGGEGDELPVTIPSQIEALVADIREHAEDAGDGDVDYRELYRHAVEDHLGGDVYEDEVCDPSDEYAEYLDCWATDYLLGEYVRKAFLGWVEDVSPIGIPAPAKDLVEDVIDEVVDTTNGESEPPPLPGVPTIPGGPAPELPDLQGMILDLVGEAAGQADNLPGAEEVLAQVREKATTLAGEVDEAFDEALDAAAAGADDAFDRVEQTTAAVENAVRETRRTAERAVDDLVEQSGQGSKVEKVKKLADDMVRRTEQFLRQRQSFLEEQLGL